MPIQDGFDCEVNLIAKPSVATQASPDRSRDAGVRLKTSPGRHSLNRYSWTISATIGGRWASVAATVESSTSSTGFVSWALALPLLSDGIKVNVSNTDAKRRTSIAGEILGNDPVVFTDRRLAVPGTEQIVTAVNGDTGTTGRVLAVLGDRLGEPWHRMHNLSLS